MAHPDSNDAEDGPVVARNSTLDAIVAACVVLLGSVVVVEARRLGAQWTSDGPGAGYFPFYIGLILVVCGAVILVQSLRARAADTSSFVARVPLGRVLSVLIPSIVYVAGIMLLGLYVASALFIVAFMMVLGKYAAHTSVAVGVAVSAVFFLMFEVWFKVPLFKGALNPLGFLGY